MPKVICVDDSDGSRHELAVDAGCSLMSAAVAANVAGIVAECGGSCSCATCHVYVAEEWCDALDEPTPEETDLLEFLESVRPNSRLSCQILLTDELDGLTVRVPESAE
ncbi:2Fe-2S iron-sulfur cluster-binding protein [Amycolatopsis acidiphila]|uniref:2Fe-2S iron-sulfur cluster binding domain-containing protein n=2 Tax=Amycolatopsis acidiphila TaxID=715473 RepID=A0A557ZZW8_9PSEU|nr:2Fe-2S iron-sulfur cluster-binding protein [Amycolatopsis acidiphila]TVT17544.1 2Fe-2S iron-sulfur cluster binding domain-containing protein [Amycolatopsis acidiphila]GHG95385.1 (2Fe-2S) ferredoxin [Amycolatopsis acidiphila]